MAGNLPPGAAGDPRAPWNQPDPEDLLPLECERCGFRAHTLEELEDHEHAGDSFVQPQPDHQPCMVCCPPDDAHQRARSGRLVFCSSHDRGDWKQKLDADAEHRREELERERYERGGGE